MGRRVVLLSAAALLAALLGCGSGGGEDDIQDLVNLIVGAGETRSLESERVNISGDATIDGTVNALGDTMVLNIAGDLTLNGKLSADDPAETPDPDDASALGDLPGIILIVGGDVTIGEDAEIETEGVTVVTDSEATLDQTLAEANADAESADGTLPTFMPLPPDDEAFGRAAPAVAKPGASRQGGGSVGIGGTWTGGPGAGIIFRFDRPDTDLVLDATTINVLTRPDPADNDQSGESDAGKNATGANGKNGANLLIWNNSGSINVLGNVTINLPDGQAGQNAKAVCATATGGNGGKPGNFKMTARDGVDISEGTLTVNPGKGGRGGNATVTGQVAGGGCPGQKGCDVTATGGKGGENKKRLFTRGPVTGIENVRFGDVVGGAGGFGDATAGEGGAGNACCDGGAGGVATATGGAGGDATFNFGSLPISAAGATGGDGGDGTAVGGKGGHGGDCKSNPGGDGGPGGTATATGGKGGNATGDGPKLGGGGGDADATGGDGGDGGDSTTEPGAGGAGAGSTATEGAGGTPSGDAGTPTEADGTDGEPGDLTPILVSFCWDFGFLPDGEGTVDPGDYTATLLHPETGSELGTMPVNLAAQQGGQLFRSENPIKHFGIQGPGTITMDLDHINPPSDPIVGMRIVPLFGQGISESNPLGVGYLGEGGMGNGGDSIVSIPDNRGNLDNPAFCQVDFHLSPGVEGAGTVHIDVPAGAFVTFIRIYLLDP